MSVVDAIDLGYVPRARQLDLHAAIDHHRWTVAVCHRRFGKSVAAINHLIQAALECPQPRPRFALIAPTYRQAKMIAWDYLKLYTRNIPGVEQRESDLTVNMPGDRRVTLYGADHPDSLRGSYFDGVVFDEFGLQPGTIFSEVVRAALADRAGWGVFLGTPNGRNEFFQMAERAKANDDGHWAYQEHKASETGILSAEELSAARAVMTPDQYEQEFECSFSASVQGSIYTLELAAARAEGRVGIVPVDKILPVDTTWDLGVGDATSVIFSQGNRAGDLRIVDYYEASGEGLPHYAKVLQDKNYTYGRHMAPHDIQVRELGTGRSRLEVAASLGIRFETVPRVHTSVSGEVEEGIHAARMLLSRCWFDATRCKALLESLQHYRREYNTRLNEFRATPVHDWSSHGADALRYLATWYKPTKPRPVPPTHAAPASSGAWLGA
jgi:phage terminase large subunit